MRGSLLSLSYQIKYFWIFESPKLLTVNLPSQALAKKSDRVQTIHRWTAKDASPHRMVKSLYFESNLMLNPFQKLDIVFFFFFFVNQQQNTLPKRPEALCLEYCPESHSVSIHLRFFWTWCDLQPFESSWIYELEIGRCGCNRPHLKGFVGRRLTK